MLSGTDEGAKTKFSASDGIIENFCRAYVDFGSLGDIGARLRGDRFAPESRHRRLLQLGPLSAAGSKGGRNTSIFEARWSVQDGLSRTDPLGGHATFLHDYAVAHSLRVF